MDTITIGLQTNNTLIAYNISFKERELNKLKRAGFLVKPLQQLTTQNALTFNGTHIIKSTMNTIAVSQYEQAKKIELLDLLNINQEEYISQQAHGAYISLVCQLQVTFRLLYTTQTTELTNDDINKLNKCLKWQIENKEKGLMFMQLKGNL